MTQNIYDTPEFFERYRQLDRSVEGLAGAPEWPALRALVPDLRGLRVMDLGCGFGWFCRFARQHGAAQVLGVDVSANMLAQARALTSDAAIAYQRADLEHFDLPEAAFDFAFSALTLHYIENIDRLMANLHRVLIPGAQFVMSMEHPIFTAPTHPRWSSDAGGRKMWPIDRYLVEGSRTTDWLTRGVVKQHRTIGTTLNLLIRSGFKIAHVEEWKPTDAQIAAKPALAEELERPMFLFVSATRQAPRQLPA